MIAPALSLLRRLMGSCPLWHRTPDRYTQVDVDGQGISYTCVLCGRHTSEALSGHPKGAKIQPARAKLHHDWWRKQA